MNNLKTLETIEKLENDFDTYSRRVDKLEIKLCDLIDANKNTQSTETAIEKLNDKIYKIQNKIEKLENLVSRIMIKESTSIEASETELKNRFNNISKIQETKIYTDSAWCDYKIYISNDTPRLLLIINNYNEDKSYLYSCEINFLNEINKTAIENIKKGY